MPLLASHCRLNSRLGTMGSSIADNTSVGLLISFSHLSGHAQSKNGCNAGKGKSLVLPPT